MKHFVLLSFLFAGLAICLSSCDKEEPIPFYLSIPSVEFEITNPGQGTASHDITDVWVFADEEFLGTYELPATIPILKEGRVAISLLAGVKKSGISINRSTYPFYEFALDSLTAVPGGSEELIPTFTYDTENTLFVTNTNFELANDYESKVDGSTLFLTADQDIVFEGARCAQIIPSATDSTWRIGLINSLPLSHTRLHTWIELNYYSTTPFEFLMISSRGGANQFFIYQVINPTDEWKKMYIDITELLVEASSDPLLSTQSGTITHEISFQSALKDSAMDTILFDNLKILTSPN